MFSLACIHPSLYLKPEMYMVLLIEVFLTQPTLMRYVDLSPFFFFAWEAEAQGASFYLFFWWTTDVCETHKNRRKMSRFISDKQRGKRSLRLFFSLSAKWGVLNYSFRERSLAASPPSAAAEMQLEQMC